MSVTINALEVNLPPPPLDLWFSTDMGFYVQRPDRTTQWQRIEDGDLLSTRGYVVARNLDLLSAFAPVEDPANFGLDAVAVAAAPAVADLDQDGDVDRSDLEVYEVASSGRT